MKKETGTFLYRFRIDLSDVGRSVYEQLDFRLAQHPSESLEFLLTRCLAYCLSVEPGLAFSAGGLSDPDTPCLSSDDPRGGKSLWIEIGNPSARRLHKAAKASKRVKVYTYKNPGSLLDEIREGDVFQAEKIEVFSFAPEFLERLEALLERDNEWTLVVDQGSLMLSADGWSETGELRRHSL